MVPPAASARYPSPSQPSGKSEVTDLKSQLRQLAGSRAPGVDDSKRDLFKKVISYMTIGIDVSSVFGEMVMCSATSDIVLKKMCYLYVGNYAKGNPDLSLLTINFLQRDCKDEDPMIRGLALRSLCSLRVPNLVEYLLGPLGSGLKDNNSYVRTIAVTGVLKLYHISASTCIDAEFPATLKSLMLHDSDAQVVANCLAALQEIWSLEASHSEEACREKESLLSKPLIYYFLNRIKEFNEWAQCLILELAVKYVPSDSNDIFDIMNLLEDRLQHANGAVVLATVKVFLQLTLSMTDVHQQVYERIKSPLLTLVSSGSPEQSYAILSHLHLLVVRAPFIFASDYKHFYCQYNEPSYVKKLKLEMLTAIANESNTYEIVTELCEYAANVDIEIARESIRAVGKIALQQYDVNAIVDRLLQFLEMEKDYVTAETLVLVKDLLRKHPLWSHDCISVVGSISSKNIQEPKAKAALIWMLGEYAQDMSDAPYILENLIENWEEEHSAEVRLHLLTAAMKCFFKRAPETQKALGIALAAGIADFHQDVHDRALFYYRVLQHDVHVAERVVSPPQQAVSAFADTQSSEIKDRIFDEFNSLSVIYQKPSYMFTDKEHRGPFAFSDELGSTSITPEVSSDIVPAQQFEANDKDLLLSTDEKDDNKGLSSNNGSAAYTAPYETSNISSQMQELAISGPATTTTQSSFDFDDLLGLGLSTAPAPTPSPPLLKLNPRAALDPRAFQQKWRQLPISLTQEFSVNPQGIAALTVPQSLIKHMQSHSIHCIASGGQSPNFKFFFYAQKEAEPSDYLTIARYLPGRIGKQCRERWHNHLNPAINKEAWTQEEELVLIRAHQVYGNRWAELTKFLPGRSDNGIKNHWHSSVKKKMDSYMSSGLLDQYQAMPLAPYERSSTLQSIDGYGCVSGHAEKEVQNSQMSSMAGCSLSAMDYQNGIINMGQHFHPCENSHMNKGAAYHPDQYHYPELEDISVSISELSYDMEDCSQFPDHNVSASSCQGYHFDLQELSDISVEMRHNMSELPMPYTKESNETSLGASNSTSNIDLATHTNTVNVSETECCRILFLDQESEDLSVSRSSTQEPNEVFCASASDSQISEATKSPMQSSSSKSIATSASGKETLRPAPLIISPDKYSKKSSGLICHPFEAEPNENGSFITCANEGPNNSSEEDQSYHLNDSKKLVPVNDFASLSDVKPRSLPKHEPNTTVEQHHEDTGESSSSLSFPRLDLPIFSSDLLQSKNDPLHDYSPLGIRKLLMSTMTCMSPLRLWESPTGKRTLVGAKSILRKRTRDLLTPLSEKRSDKKLEIDIAAGLAKDFSRLDVMFDESERGVSTSDEKSEQNSLDANVKEKGVQNVESLSGVLSENNTNKQVLSPGQSVSKAEKAQVSTPRNHLQRTLMATSNKEQHSPASVCLVINSPSRARNTEGQLVDNETSNESFSIFCGTPFRRELESPSAWKSPFYVNSLLHSPRFDTDITIEDMGYIFSPVERSYGSRGLQRNEHTSAFAAFDAMELSLSASNYDDTRKMKELDKENNDPQLAERRVLDFNDCESPTKQKKPHPLTS